MSESKTHQKTKVLTFSEITPENNAGGKGASLAKMYQAGLPVPEGFIIPSEALETDNIPPETWTQITENLQELRDHTEQAFAVRSSARSEDSETASFAGGFETRLNLYTDTDIKEAIINVFNSGRTERVRAYSKQMGVESGLELAVIVQKLVDAECSGVLFTANPVNGSRDEAIITATWGLGEAIVRGLVTPDTITVNKKTGKIITKEITEKQVMTIRLKTHTTQKPVPEDKKNSPVLSSKQVQELNQLGTHIEQLYQKPMDIEWALQDGVFFIVQARPITSLPEPLPNEWKLPSKGTAVRNNIIELMADPITPLFGSLGRESINRGIDKQMTEFFGRPQFISPEPIVLVNHYAYYSTSIGPLKILELLIKSPWILNRMLRGAIERWTDRGLPEYRAIIEKWNQAKWRECTATRILDASKEIMESAITAYMALVSGVIPAAWLTEALFTFTYNRLIKRQDDPDAPTFLMGFDNIPIRAEKNLYTLALLTHENEALIRYLNRADTQEIIWQLRNPDLKPATMWIEWRNRFNEHLDQYGHTIYNLDFSNDTPADNPAPLLESFKLFLRGQGVDPFTRQQDAEKRRIQATETIIKRHRGIQGRIFKWALRQAQRFAPLREDGLADIGLGYPLLRQMLLELGRRLTIHHAIDEPDDVFWLRQEELIEAVENIDKGKPLEPLMEKLPRRKAEIQSVKHLTPPLMLPKMKILGYELAKIRISKEHAENVLKGVATSPGQVTGIARVMENPEDFHQMNHGDILVASITTPAWTPLFALASGIVTDVGGPLSHGSIVAREYGIPAVLGCGDATKRITSGQTITVDGTMGLVYL